MTYAYQNITGIMLPFQKMLTLYFITPATKKKKQTSASVKCERVMIMIMIYLLYLLATQK
jgi:hypothetical protein